MKFNPSISFIHIITLLWAIPVGLTALSMNPLLITGFTIGASLISVYLIILKPKYVLIILPLFALLSPIAGFFNVFGIPLLLSDFVFVLLIIQVFVLSSISNIPFTNKPFVIFFSLIAFLFIFSIVFSNIFGILISIKPLIFLIQFYIIFFYTIQYSNDEKNWLLIIDSWVNATLLGSIILIYAFRNGTNLTNFNTDNANSNLDKDNLVYLFQASYYYAGFHFILGISIIIVIIRIILSKLDFTLLFNLAKLLLLFIALLLMFNKTAIISVLLALIAIIVLFVSLNPKKYLHFFVIFLSILTVVSVFAFQHFISSQFDSSQSTLYLERAISISSLSARFNIYVTAFNSWLSYPVNMIIGLGPSFLDGSGKENIAKNFTESEGTVDSGWISYLLELGFISFFILIYIFKYSISSLITYINKVGKNINYHTAAIYILGALFFLVVALFTQMLGYTKTSWLPFQLLIIGCMNHKNLNTLKNGKSVQFKNQT